MYILVEIKNKLLGDSVFWEGEDVHISEIRNIVVKELAIEVSKDGKTRRNGMWVVSEVRIENY